MHQVNEQGIFLCSAVMKHASVVTTRKGFKACGHCTAYLTDATGAQMPFTMRDLLLSKKEKGGKI